MAVRDRSGTHIDVPTRPTLTGANTPSRAPWYARFATTAGRPAVLTIALAMCAPGEYHLARLAGWSNPWALGMPAALSAYAGIAAVVAATRPKGSRARGSAIAGAGIAIILALAAQVIAHEIDRGHMIGNQAWLIGIISAVPPAVVGHLLHLAATPTGVTPVNGPSDRAFRPAERVAPAPVMTPPAAPLPVIPPQPAIPPIVVQAPAPAPIAYSDPRCAAIRPLYDGGYRPSTSSMRTAIIAAGLIPGADGTLRGPVRKEVERHEPHLASYPAEPTQLLARTP